MISYKEFMPRLRKVIPGHYLEDYKCSDQGLLVNLTKNGSPGYKRVMGLSKGAFSSYVGKNNTRTIHSVAKDIISDCAATYFISFLNDIENSDDDDFGVLSERIMQEFYDLIPELNETNAVENLGRFFLAVISNEAAEKQNSFDKNNIDHLGTNIKSLRDVPLELIDNINNHKDLYVNTKVFITAYRKLLYWRRVLLVGEPGAGKSFTSEMIAKEFIDAGFYVRFSNQTENIKELLDGVLSDSDKKELIYIDDCLGQIVMTLCSNQESDLRKLIVGIRNSKNKYLLLNSRVTIVTGVVHSEKTLGQTINYFYDEGSVVSVEKLSDLEKAEILYKHLQFMPGVRKEYYDAIRSNENFFKIIEHKNFNPRIIWHITQRMYVESTSPDNYLSSILDTLNNPDMIWDGEYNNKLSIPERLLLTTIYSLTSSSCNMELCKKAYNSRIQLEDSIDQTKDNWRKAFSILNGSMIKVSRFYDLPLQVEMINPSVNDYLANNIMLPGSREDKMQKKAIIAPRQVVRLYGKDKDALFKKMLVDGSILDLFFSSSSERNFLISYYTGKYGIYKEEYKQYVLGFVTNPHEGPYYMNVNAPDVFVSILRKRNCYNYYLSEMSFKKIFNDFCDIFNLESFCKIVSTVCYYEPELYRFLDPSNYDEFIEIMSEEVACAFYDDSDECIQELVIETTIIEKSTLNADVNETLRGDIKDSLNDLMKEYPLPELIRIELFSIIDAFYEDFSEEIKMKLEDRESAADEVLDDDYSKYINERKSIVELFKNDKIPVRKVANPDLGAKLSCNTI